MIRARNTLFVVAAIPVLLSAGAARAQCDGGWSMSIQTESTGSINAATLWDPDGPGPSPELLVVGGHFSSIDGVAANNLATFDGATWRPLSGAVTAAPDWSITHLVVLNGELIVAGGFSEIGGVPALSIAAWNSAQWHPLGAGLPQYESSEGGFAHLIYPISAMVVHNNELYVGGHIMPTDFAHRSGVSRWDGHDFVPVPGAGPDAFGFVRVLASFHDQLIAGGTLWEMSGREVHRVAAFDGKQWRPLGKNLANGTVTELIEFRGELHAGGTYDYVSDDAYIGRWDGSDWSRFGQGLGRYFRPTSFTVYRNRLVVGLIPPATYAPRDVVAAWDGTSWSAFADELPPGWPRPVVQVVQAYGDQLLVTASSFVAAWSQPTADFTPDGFIDWSDYLEFLTLFDALDPATDLNDDGSVDFADYLAFLDLYASAC